MADELSRERAQALATLALGHVTRRYPHKLDHVMSGTERNLSPARLHPLFFGSFDWHSCVHGYWTLARLLSRFGDLPSAPAVIALFDRQFTAAKVSAEVAYFERQWANGFGRPYGWAWLLKLAEELGQHCTRSWRAALQPLADLITERFVRFLPLATYPIRNGSHGNTAFALRFAADYAIAAGNAALLDAMRGKAEDWYGSDRDCQAWEPGGDDFLSPALIEAACMARLLPRDAFRHWFEAFLPRIGARSPETLFKPASVTDRADGKLAHLDGLNLSRAWCWRLVAAALGPDDPRRRSFEAAASAHLAASLGHLDTTYMGGHWLASFALLALDRAAQPAGE